MSPRPALDVSAPEFGRWLAGCRGDRSLEQVALRVRPLVAASGLKVNRASLHHFEAGRVPSWPMLAAFSVVYGVPLLEVVARLVAALEFPGSDVLIPPAADLTTNPRIEVGHGEAPARLHELEQELAAHRALFTAAHRLALNLTSLTAAGAAVPAADGRQPRRRISDQ